MATATWAVIRCPRRSGFRNSGLVSGDVEDPVDVVNMEEQIPCFAFGGITIIRSGTIGLWRQLLAISLRK
jgi:hypothetical protein